MPAVTLDPTDLEPFADIEFTKALGMIEDALALAERVAPCITTEDFAYPAAAKAILRRAVLRWNEAGTGAVTQRGAGPFQETIDNRQPHRSLFWPSEIDELQALCAESGDGGAFAVDTVSNDLEIHAAWCSLNFGATYCSCGASIAGYPIFGEPA